MTVSPLFFPEKLAIFLVITVAFIHFTRGPPPVQCHPAPFLPVRPRLSTIYFVNSTTIFFRSGVTPLEGVTRGSPPHPPFPSSDATVVCVLRMITRKGHKLLR